MSEVKYPQIHITLVGVDGNASALLMRVKMAMKRVKLPHKYWLEFEERATSIGDYDNLLRVVMETVTCDEVEDKKEYRCLDNEDDHDEEERYWWGVDGKELDI